MIIKEKIKKEIDLLPDELLDQIQKYIDSIKVTQVRKKIFHTLHLKGQFGNLNLRQKAYE